MCNDGAWFFSYYFSCLFSLKDTPLSYYEFSDQDSLELTLTLKENLGVFKKGERCHNTHYFIYKQCIMSLPQNTKSVNLVPIGQDQLIVFPHSFLSLCYFISCEFKSIQNSSCVRVLALSSSLNCDVNIEYLNVTSRIKLLHPKTQSFLHEFTLSKHSLPLAAQILKFQKPNSFLFSFSLAALHSSNQQLPDEASKKCLS